MIAVLSLAAAVESASVELTDQGDVVNLIQLPGKLQNAEDGAEADHVPLINPPRPLEPSPFLTICSLFAVAALLAAMMNETREKVKTDCMLTTTRRRVLQAIALGQILLDLAESSFVIPFSYDFARSIRHCSGSKGSLSFLSGIIQSSSPFGMMFGLYAAFEINKLGKHDLNRSCMLAAPALVSILYMALAFLLQSAANFEGFLEALVILTRALTGFASGFDLLFSTLARDVTLPKEQVGFSILEYVALSAGLGVGPLLSSSASISVERGCGSYQQELRACAIVSSLYAILTFCISASVPAKAPSVPASDSEDSEENSTCEQDKQKVCLGLVAVFLGVFSCASVEVSSSLILELQYSWDVPRIGNALGLIYASVIFFCGALLMMQTCISNSFLLGISAAGIMIGAGLIFDPGNSSAWQLLVADSVLYPCLTALTAIIDGWLYMGHKPFISTSGLNLAVYLSDSMARSLAAPSVRNLIALQGRNMYACLQSALLVFLICLAFYLCRLQAERVTSSDSRRLIENGWFIEKNKDWPGLAVAIEVKEVLLHKHTAIQDMLVFQSTHWGNVLVLDGAIMCTERDEMSYQEMLAHLAMFSHDNPCQVLIVGGGDGGVMREVCKHSCVQSATLCEIDGDVVEACKRYFPAMSSSFHDKRVTVQLMDAVEYVKLQDSESHDVIIIDSSDPVGPAVKLFSQMFYKDLNRILRPGGIVCAQGESIWFDLDLIETMSTENSQIFSSAEYASIQIPTYVGGQIGAFICRKGYDASGAMGCSKPLRKPSAAMELRYYTPDLHTAAFQIPAFVKERIQGRQQTSKASGMVQRGQST